MEWVLGGRFVQCRGTRNRGESESIQIIGFDFLKREYRHWYFDSFGTIAGPMRGQWKENERTLIWQDNPQDGVLLVNRVHFIDSSTHEFHLTISSKAGEVYFEQRGKATRQKASETGH
jgi:hypothetical protein